MVASLYDTESSMRCFAEAVLKPSKSASSDTIVTLDDAAVDWLATMKAANDDFVGPALRTALVRTGLIESLPVDVRDYLELLYEENARCNRQIRAQCDRIGRALAETGVEAVLLKGAAWLFEDGPAGQDRMMRDVDLLVDAASASAARNAMQLLGYHQSTTIRTEAGHIHDAPLVHLDELASVELHVELTTRTTLLTSREVLVDSRLVAPGLRIPSAQHRIVHNVLHAQIVNGDYIGGARSLRDSLDVSRLMQAYGNKIDWAALAAEAKNRGYFRQLSGAIHKAARFAGAPLPQPFANDLGGGRHAMRCTLQHRWPLLDFLARRLGILCRALAWERDSYALQLGSDRGFHAHLKVNLRRMRRMVSAIGRGMGAA